jgi:hypothetical protein
MVSNLLLEMLRLYPNGEQRFGGKLEGGSKIILWLIDWMDACSLSVEFVSCENSHDTLASLSIFRSFISISSCFCFIWTSDVPVIETVAINRLISIRG